MDWGRNRLFKKHNTGVNALCHHCDVCTRKNVAVPCQPSTVGVVCGKVELDKRLRRNIVRMSIYLVSRTFICEV